MSTIAGRLARHRPTLPPCGLKLTVPFKRAERLKNCQLWERYPFVDRDGFAERFVELLANGEQKLVEERVNAGR